MLAPVLTGITFIKIPCRSELDFRWSFQQSAPIVADVLSRCQMGCPRCNRMRVESDGQRVRCAVCGMPYEPELGKQCSGGKERSSSALVQSENVQIIRVYSVGVS